MNAGFTIDLVAPTAADLILDMLISHKHRTLSVQGLARGAEILGIAVPSMRVALTRLLKQGKVYKTDRGQYAMNAGASPRYHQIASWFKRERQVQPWSNAWLVAHDDRVPRSQRVLWQRHSKALERHGFRHLHDTLWVRPDNLKGGIEGVRKLLETQGMAAECMLFVGTEFDNATRARMLGIWDVAQRRMVYRGALAELQRSSRALPKLGVDEAARASLLLGRAVIRTIVRDPLLPDEIMPSIERRALVETMRDYQHQAKKIWTTALVLQP